MGGILTTALMFLANKKAKAGLINKITKKFSIRECDAYGCGHYEASRGSRKHYGIDVVTQKGDAIYSPITGYLNRLAYPYASDLSYKGIEIIGTGIHQGFKVKIFYCIPTIKIGASVVAGVTKVAESQAINEKYSTKMTNHVHLEVYKDNKIIDPTNIIQGYVK